MVAAWNIVKELCAFTIPVLCAVGVMVSCGMSWVIATSASRVVVSVLLGFSMAAQEVAKMHVGLYLNFISADFMCLASFIESLEFQFGGLFAVGCPVQ